MMAKTKMKNSVEELEYNKNFQIDDENYSLLIKAIRIPPNCDLQE